MSFDSLLNNFCTIEQLTETQDSDSGEMIRSWSVVLPSVKCRLDDTGGERIVAPAQIYEKATHILYMRDPQSVSLNTKDYRIDVDGDKYTILMVIDRYSAMSKYHLEILLEKVE